MIPSLEEAKALVARSSARVEEFDMDIYPELPSLRLRTRAVSGMLGRVGSIGVAKAYPAENSNPDDIDRASLRLGMPGTAQADSPARL